MRLWFLDRLCVLGWLLCNSVFMNRGPCTCSMTNRWYRWYSRSKPIRRRFVALHKHNYLWRWRS